MVLKILLKKEIFEPIATFFTSIINDIEFWMKKILRVLDIFYTRLPLKIERKNDDSRISLCLIYESNKNEGFPA